MNILLGAILLVAGILVGMGFSRGYKRKYLFLADFHMFLEYLETNFNFVQDSLKQVLLNRQTVYNKDFNQFLASLSENIENIQPFLQKWSKEQKILNDEEAVIFVKFFEQLGRLDCETQMESIRQTKASLINFVNKANETHTKKGKLSTQLGLMAGLALFIIVI